MARSRSTSRRTATPRPAVGVAQPARSLLLAALGLAAAAFALRCVAIAEIDQLPLIRSPQLDSLEFLSWAREIVNGNPQWPAPPTHGPTYPYVLAFLLQITGGSLYAVRLCQAAIGAGSTALTMLIAGKTFNRTVALIAGVLVATYGPLVYIDISLLEEGLFIFVLLLSLVSLVHRAGSQWWSLAAGACLGIATTIRPTALVLLPLFALVQFREAAPWWMRLRRSGLMTAACLLTVVPLMLVNLRVSGSPIIRAYGGLNFYMGNHPGSDGVAEARVGQAWDQLQAEPLRLGLTTPAGQDAYFVTKTLREIGGNPIGFLKVLARKLVWLTERTEIRDTHSFSFFASQSTTLQVLPDFLFLFPLAVWGLIAAMRPKTAPLLLVGYILLFALTCVLLVIGCRYRIPMVPALAVFAGYGVTTITADLRAKRYGAVVMAGTVVAAAGLGTLAHPHGPSLNFAEEWALTGHSLVHERKSTEAEAAYQRSIELDPTRAVGWDGLGIVSLNAQRLDDAENAFRQALTKEPGWATARHHLGVVLAQRGDFEHALAELREAGLLRPDDSEIRTDLADTLVAAGMPDEALVYYRQFERVVPPNSALYTAIARAEGMGGHFAEAQESAKHALDLDRNNGEAWMLLSAAQVERGDFGEAERSLEAPAALLPNDVRVKLSWATLRYKQGRRAEAEAMLRTAVQSYPSSVQARSLLLEYAQDRAAAERFLQHLPSAGQAR